MNDSDMPNDWPTRWPAFLELIETRMNKGHELYGGKSFDAPISESLEEIQEELLDVVGWAFIAWSGIQRFRNFANGDRQRLKSALDSMVNQFAYNNDRGEWHTGGLSALEESFEALGWDDPHPMPDELLCDEPRCKRRSSCGTPTADGYRRTCDEHRPESPKQ